jgi:lipoprotein-releasing system permease protein
LQTEEQGSKVSRPIVRISVLSISLAIVVNLLTVAIVTGFQNEIREKISGFNAPIFVGKAGFSSLHEIEPVHKSKTISQSILTTAGVKGTDNVAYKPALLQSAIFVEKVKRANKADTAVQRQEISGVLMKGVSANYDWTFIKKHLKKGEIPNFEKDKDAILLSEQLAKILHFQIGDTVSAFYVKNQPVLRKYTVKGFFSTGLEEYDKKMVFCGLPEVQKLNDWGLQVQMELVDSLSENNSFILKTTTTGQETELYYNWGEGMNIYTGIFLRELRDSVYRVVIGQTSKSRGKIESLDTCELKVKLPSGVHFISSSDLVLENGKLKITFENENFGKLETKKGNVLLRFKHGKGNATELVAGWEVRLDNWSDLAAVQSLLKSKLEMFPTEKGELLQVKSVVENESELFSWLSFLDYNVMIILTLMLIIGIINIGSALLVLIVMRTNFIGLLKAMGASNWDIRRVFLWQAAFLIGKGMFYGNLIGLILCFIQIQFAPFQLDPAVYFLDKVPVELTFFGWLGVNLLTFGICMISLLLPSAVVTRISPSKAIKFN